MKHIIGKNRHGSKLWGFLPHFGITLKNKIVFETKFSENCLYNLDGVDEWDINKLFGVSTSYNHHNQSVRIGWRCLDNENIEILPYCYDKGERIFIYTNGTDEILGKVKPNETFKSTIIVDTDCFILKFEKGTECKEIKVNKSNNSWKFKYNLYPFFGGDKSAPHKMDINIKVY